MEQHSVEIVRGVYEAFGRGDLPAVHGTMAEEFEWYEAEGMPYGSARDFGRRRESSRPVRTWPSAATPRQASRAGSTRMVAVSCILR